MMLKALTLVHFWSVLLLKEQMMTSARKRLKSLVWSAQNWSISREICLENNHKMGRFLPIAFWWSLPRKLPWNSREIGRFFREFVPKNPAKFDFFFRDLSEALMRRSPDSSIFRRECIMCNFWIYLGFWQIAHLPLAQAKGRGRWAVFQKPKL